MEKRVAYPIYVKKTNKGWFAVSIPDFGDHTQGKDLADALFMARDSIGLRGICLQDDGLEIPEPQSSGYKKADDEEEYWVDVSFSEYRAEHDTRSVRKNVTIPYYLSRKAERMGINFSRVLQEALMNKLNIYY